MSDHAESGAVSTFLAVLALALLAAVGLVVDGGHKVNALREASQLADNAARAGAQAIDLDTLRTDGDLLLLPDQAEQEARDYLTSLGYTTAEVVVDENTISVTVEITFDPLLLPTGPITVTATETAGAVTEEP